RRHGLRHQGSALQHAGCKDAVGIVERWTEDLAARYVLEGCGDAAMGEETLLPDWLGYRQARLRRSPRAQQEHGLVKVAAGLRQGQRREFGFIEGSLAHDPVHQPGQRALHLSHPRRVDGAEARAIETLRLGDRTLAAF